MGEKVENSSWILSSEKERFSFSHKKEVRHQFVVNVEKTDEVVMIQFHPATFYSDFLSKMDERNEVRCLER